MSQVYQISIKNKYNKYDYDQLNVYLYKDQYSDYIDKETEYKEAKSDLLRVYKDFHINTTPEGLCNSAIYYNMIGDFDRSKKLLILSKTPFSILNYGILYNTSYIKKALDMMPDNYILIAHYIEYLITLANYKSAELQLNILISKIDSSVDIGGYLFNIGFRFQDDVGNYDIADKCFGLLLTLDPNKEYNIKWIEQGKRISSFNKPQLESEDIPTVLS